MMHEQMTLQKDLHELEEEFLALTKDWRDETGHLSSIEKKAMHPAYQQIIGMGPFVVPLILRELRAKPDHWFWALKAITRANPVKPEQRGRMKEMTNAWLDWAVANGYEQ